MDFLNIFKEQQNINNIIISYFNLQHPHILSINKDILLLITQVSKWTESTPQSHFGKYNLIPVPRDL
jgi:hypothetical protein